MPPWADSRVCDDGIAGSHDKYRPAPSFSSAPPVTNGWAGTSAEQHVVDALAAPVLQVPAEQVPDVATLLLGRWCAGAGQPGGVPGRLALARGPPATTVATHEGQGVHRFADNAQLAQQKERPAHQRD